jgi:AcrR family transcriptional regulator
MFSTSTGARVVRTEQIQERRQERRAARREANRSEILDAAERVFGRVGLHNGSMREIAAEAGFSTAAIYLFFENRQELLAEAALRHVDALVALLEATIAASDDPLQALHAIVDETLEFHEHRRDFWRLRNQIPSGVDLVAAELGAYAVPVFDRFGALQALLVRLMRAGQRRGTTRRGDPEVLTRLYMVMNNEYLTVNLEGGRGANAAEFHALLDDAFGAGRVTS